MTRPRVLIIGGGFAGLACALELDAEEFAVTLVDQRRDFEFIPNIHELISGTKRPGELRLPLGKLLRERGHRFRCAQVARVDPQERRISLAKGRPLRGDYLVIATGSADADFGVASVHRHALLLKSVADGRAIAMRLSALEKSPARRRVVIVGAGLAGVEALGEVLRRGSDTVEVHMVEAGERLLPAAPPAVSRWLEKQCRDRGVTLHLGQPVTKLTAKTVWLAGGERLPSDATIWTGGPAPPQLLEDSQLSSPGSWLAVQADLSVPGCTGVFAAGDSAELPRPLSRQAYFALDMGSVAAKNIRRLHQGRSTIRLRPLPRPTLLAFGDISAVLIAGRSAFAGKALMAVKEGIYTAVMAQLDRRRPAVRVGALVARGRSSGAQLWPLLNPAQLLGRAGKVQRLRSRA